MEWVEVEAKSVDAAIDAALQELGLSSRDEASVEIIQEPEKGFLGFGGTEAIVRVKPAPKGRSRGRRQGRRRGKPSAGGEAGQQAKQGGGRKGGAKQGGGGNQARKPREGDSRRDGRKANGNKANGNKGQAQQEKGRKDQDRPPERRRSEPSVESTQEVDVAVQAEILKDFMEGLIGAFGLEGTTTTRIEDDIIHIDVTGEQTEALVGPRGVILQSILDLMKIVVQRKTHHRARIRLDIAGYAERRRAALGIYSQRLSEQVLADGEEVMLEPMHPGDRKVVHDAVAEIEGVRSWSEGEEPNRSVIIGLAPGFEASGASDDDE